MESFLEANRIVESSLVKLNRSRQQGMPLRKALFVSNVMNRAQEVAKSAHISFMNSVETPSRPSKLLASMKGSPLIEEDTAVNLMDPAEHRQTTKTPQSAISPVALTAIKDQTQDDEVMEFISNSVLSDILKDEEEMDTGSSTACTTPTTNTTWSPLSDVSNTWPSWTKPKLTLDKWQPEENCSASSPPSPGKRQHDIAFPTGHHEHTTLPLNDISKRFKSCSEDPLLSSSYSPPLSSMSTMTVGFNNPFLPLSPSSPLSCVFNSNSPFTLSWSTLFNQNSRSSTENSRTLSSSPNLYPVLAY